MLSLYAQLAYALYNHQRYNTFNKSARVHYALMYYLILTCKPKLYEYDITQQSALRYLLLPKKAIDESISLLKTKRNSPSRHIIDSIVDLDDSSSDEINDAEEDESDVPKRTRGKRPTVKTTESVKPPRKTRTARNVSAKPAAKNTRKPRETKTSKK